MQLRERRFLQRANVARHRRREIAVSATASAQSRRHAINAISIRIRVLPRASNLFSSSTLSPIVTLAFIVEIRFRRRVQNKRRRSPGIREAHSQPSPVPFALLFSTLALFRALCVSCAFRARKRDVYYRACLAISILSRRRFCFVLLLSGERDKELHS